jgi:hypothetical protein
MSAQPGEPTPNAFVFPPFAPPAFRPAAESPAPAEAPPAARDEPVDFGIEVPLPAHDLGDADDGQAPAAPLFDGGDDAAMPWDAAPVEDAPAPPASDHAPFVNDTPPVFADGASDGGPFASDAVPFAEPDMDPFIEPDVAPFDETDPLAFAESEAVEAEAPSAEPAPAADDLPWLELPNGAPRAQHAAEEPATGEVLPDWMAWGLNGEPAPEPAGPSTAEFDIGDLAPDAPAEAPYAEDAAPPADEMPWLDTSAIHTPDEPAAFEAPAQAAPAPYDEPLPEYASTLGDDAAPYADAPPAFAAPSDPRPAAAPVLPDGAFAEVAGRLEGIARALRDDPGAFLAGAGSDPLGLLVTGFVLGYGQRPRD